MPRQRNYYDPIVQERGAPSISDVQLLGLDIEGVAYVRLTDVVIAIETYADTVQMPERGVVLDIARWLGSSDTSQVEEESQEPVLVEVFPDADGRWHARAVGENGHVLKVTNGSFDENYVIKDASERWPGLTIQRLQHESEDSMWKEQKRFGPSQRLWHSELT